MLFSIYSWQTRELSSVACTSLCSRSLWCTEVNRALLNLSFELNSVLKELVSVQTGLTVIQAVRVYIVLFLFAGRLFEERRTLLKLLVLTYKSLLHFWDTFLSCLAVKICVNNAFPPDLVLRKSYCSD